MALKEPSTARPNNGEAQPTPFYRRRSVQAGGGALLALVAAGGLFAGLHSSNKDHTLRAVGKSLPHETINPPSKDPSGSSTPELNAATNVNVATNLCNSATSTIVQKIMNEQVRCTNDSTAEDAFGPNVESFFTKWDPIPYTISNAGDETLVELINTSKDAQMRQGLYSLSVADGEKVTIDGNQCRIDSSHKHLVCLLGNYTTAIVSLPVGNTSLQDFTQVMKSAIESSAS